MKFVNKVLAVVRSEEGQDLLEYALLTALIALAAVTAIGLAGSSVSGVFNAISTQISSIPA